MTIEPGVVVNGGKIEAFGNLNINGNAESLVRLENVSVNLKQGGDLNLNYTQMLGGRLLNLGDTSGVFSDITITNNVFSDVLGSIYIGSGRNVSSAAPFSIDHNLFVNSGGLYVSAVQTPISITNNTFLNQRGDGYEYSSGERYAVQSSYGTPSVTGNNFLSVDRVALQLSPYASSGAYMNAQENWFGTTNRSTINSMIRDKNDNLNYSSVINIDPVLTASNPNAPRVATEGPDSILGSNDADLLFGLGGADTIKGGAGNDQIYGHAGNDILYDGQGSDLIVGGIGWDVGSSGDIGRHGASFSFNAAESIVVRMQNGDVDRYKQVEIIQYADGRMVFDLSDPAAQVVRLYQAGLGRQADQTGLNHWISGIEDGAPLSNLANGFLTSQEFASRYGSNLSTPDFVERLYVNALGRASDAQGKANWVDWINKGTISRADALVGFSESVENRANTAGIVQKGIWDVSEDAAFIARLYDTTFGRLPDLAGLQNWRQGLDTGGATVADVVKGFIGSAEFANRYGAGVSTSDFVELLYVNSLDRASDPGGKANWVRAINADEITRADAVLGFSESNEHKALTAPNIMSENPDQYGIVFG
ncbi:DUF4214 domain-containing protein [Roseomonas sp. WA12]